MPYTKKALVRIGLAAILSGVPCVMVVAADPPDSEVNPQSGYIETTDSMWASTNYNVRHVTDPGEGQALDVFTVSDDTADDLGSRITIASNGDTWVVWWRDTSTDQVLIRKRTYSNSSWGTERTVSSADESSRYPEIVNDGTDPWVAYEFDDAGGTSIAVGMIVDEPDPIPSRRLLATTSYSGDVDVLIHSESGHLWVTWVDSATQVAWSEYNYATDTWSSPNYDSYANDDIDAARARIRNTVLGI